MAKLSPAEIRQRGLFPEGFKPLSHPNHGEGGQVLPQFHIDEILFQEGRDLQRFDLDMDLPEHLLPEFPPPLFLPTRPDLGDVSQGNLITVNTLPGKPRELPIGVLDSSRLLTT